jgi:hypothetical protein
MYLQGSFREIVTVVALGPLQRHRIYVEATRAPVELGGGQPCSFRSRVISTFPRVTMASTVGASRFSYIIITMCSVSLLL